MLSEQYKYCWAGVSWNLDGDCVLLQISEKEEESFPDLPSQVRIKLTPEEALELANKLESIARMLTNSSGLV